MSRPFARAVMQCAMPLLVLAGCSELDPVTKDGAWRPVGANDTNLRAMVAVPGDLVLGRAARTSDGNQAARAVDRLRTNRVYPLPEPGGFRGGGGGGGGSPGAGGEPQ